VSIPVRHERQFLDVAKGAHAHPCVDDRDDVLLCVVCILLC
jgi:hypothetical protein